MSRRYPPEVHEFIRKNVTGRTTEKLADMTNKAFGTVFTTASMKSYKANHKLKSGTPSGLPKGHASHVFPQRIVDHIYANYAGVGPTAMAATLNDIFDTAYTPAQLKSFYANHDLNSGLTGHFQKGHIPCNKGQKGICAPGCEKGWFPKGGQPWDTVPVGTILKKSDGYLWKKIDDVPNAGIKNWRQLHLLVWEKQNGPIPEGCRIIFKDGNRENCEIDNLALVSLAENAVMNHCGLRYNQPELTDTGILIAKVKIAASKRSRKKK